MNNLTRAFFLVLLLPLSLFAGIESHSFDNPAQEALYVKLTKELRCLVCQNQNLADSNADLAKDLREKAYTMVKQGKSHDQITEYMIARYGDFVMYRPPMKKSTYLLWIGPFVFLILALMVLFYFVRKNSSDDDNDTPSRAEIDAARKHLN
jgi:cytochrome c-type biogenesis protein CcmH